MTKALDLITIGRSSVDLSGAQIGGRLEDMGSLDKYIGGSPTNIACGAFAVSRHGGTPAHPSWEEFQFFFDRGIKQPDLRNDAELEQVHWATNRAGDWSSVKTFAFDHRLQLEEMEGYTLQKGGAFKQLWLDEALRVQDRQPGYGMLRDNRIGRAALHRASGSGLWIGRPTALPGSRPIEFEPELGEELGRLREWARENVVKLLVFCYPDDDDRTAKMQMARVKQLFTAARRNRLEFLLEIIPSKVGAVDDTTSATLIQSVYGAGIYPDWWKLEPFRTDAAWANTVAAIERNDTRTRGIVVLGLDAPQDELAASFALAAKQPLVKGDAAWAWMKGDMSDAEAVAQMADRYAGRCWIWDNARAEAAQLAKRSN